ncbi:MAG: hypothetical protein GY822_18915 [Deltaproteobacteria bacterium]|nr:hypothetical protein [Deltaproteobacteria bacterium]
MTNSSKKAQRVPQKRSPIWGSAAGRTRVLGFAFAALFFVGAGCECEESVASIDQPPTLPVCDLDTSCSDRQAYRYGQCTTAGCETDGDCCPGSRCRLDLNSCWPMQLNNEFSCDVDADCPDPAQRCKAVTIGEREPLLACAYDRCEGDTECGIGRACFQSVCTAKAPCGGGCPQGEVCDVLTSTCMAVDGIGCDRDCGASAMLVATDPDNMSGELCCTTICQCKALPPLVPYRYGKYSRITSSSSELLVSAYDHEYGDLVVVHFKIDGSFHSVEYVDGVPAGGTAVADILGPRGGVEEAGPNVGTHTSIATNAAGMPRVAYHDVDAGALKVAVKTASGWNVMTVDDGGDGKVGQFTDVAVDSATGNILVSYTALGVAGAPGVTGAASGVKVARSKVPEPSTSADWDFFFVDVERSFDPCNHSCGPTQACVLEAGEGVCKTETTGCAPACNSISHCVDDGAPTCLANVLPEAPEGFPRSRGLHTRITLNDDGTYYIAAYDSVLGQVRLSSVAVDGTSTTNVIDGDGQDGRSAGDTGRFPALATNANGNVVLVYEDSATHRVRMWQGVFGESGTFETVDEGTALTTAVDAEIGKRHVGAGASLVMSGGEPVVVYQDASNLDLKLATRAAGVWTASTVQEEGAHGFYSDLVVVDGKAFIASVKAELDERNTEASRISISEQVLP